MKMIENVAKAIAKKRYGGLIWPEINDHEYKQIASPFLREARAAIEAVRGPNEKMIDVGAEVVGSRSEAIDVFDAMIDEALKE